MSEIIGKPSKEGYTIISSYKNNINETPNESSDYGFIVVHNGECYTVNIQDKE
ncbi:MAG: hypothetical protein LN588_04075 [Rickettsia endosymbiont of Bryobia graminum]|nr:hypothetical protein [Rickettsia endosymbiont of Bryobia graminum]